MDNLEARSILSLYRKGEDVEDPRFAEAKTLVASDPALAQWWTQEQEIDDAIAAKFAATPIPADLKARLRPPAKVLPMPHRGWRREALMAAAAIIALAVVFGSWRSAFQPAPSLADYRDEMVSFLKVAPSLELETSDLGQITRFLDKSGGPSPIDIPPSLRKLDPVGCRTLRFRGHNVALVCFKRSSGRLAHLLVIDRAALPRWQNSNQPQFAGQGEWMTAAWAKNGQVYLLAVQGDHATAERLISDA